MTESNNNKRDDLLDIAKGIGIMLVVLGHTLQGFYTDFDHNIIFRIIYSFHMPLFFFISGAVLCMKNNFTQSSNQSEELDATPTQLFLNKCKKSFLHLMIPFFVWTLILFFTGKRYQEVSFIEWIFMVVKSADYSLWFLIALFNCLLFFYLSQYLFSVVGFDRSPKFSRLTALQKQIYFLLTSLLCSVMVAKFLPNWLGISFYKHYYQYLIFGGLWQVYFRYISPKLTSVIAVLLFSLLVPYWYRVEPSPIAIILSEYIKHNNAEILYKLIVALTGALAILTLASLIQSVRFNAIKKFFAYCGTISLGIYVFQFQFLGIKPYFFAPLLLSIITSFIVIQLPIIKLLLLGVTDNPQKITTAKLTTQT